MSDKQLILAFFADQAAAESAASSLKTSEVAEGDAIGVLVLDGTGRIVVDKVGATSVAAGVGVGAALLVLGPFALGFGAAAAVVGGGVGMVGGGYAGSMHHKGLKLSEEDKGRIGAELSAGKAAVGVLAPVDQGGFIQQNLTALGGAASVHDVVDEAELRSAAAAA